MHNLRIAITSLLTAASLLHGGCSSVVNSHSRKKPMLDSYLRGDSAAVLKIIGSRLNSTSGTGDELMWVLEAGSMNFFTGNYSASLNYFRKAEELINEYDERAMISLRDGGAEAVMAMTNLNALPYRGFCRDRIMLSFYKALAYLGDAGEEAFHSQLRRLRDEQKRVIANYRNFFEAEQRAVRQARLKNQDLARNISENNDRLLAADASNPELAGHIRQAREVANRGYGDFLNPAALFLSGLGSIREGYYDNAVIDFRRLYEAMPDSPTARKYYVTVLKNADMPVPPGLQTVRPFDFPLGSDSVYVLFGNGRSAAFRQVAIYFPVMTAWPVCAYFPAPYSTFRVVGGGITADSALLADMDGILSQEYNQRLAGIITRIAVSTALKETAHYAGTWVVAREAPLAAALIFTGGLAYKITFNTADTRSWELLPKELQLTQFPMPEDRRITIIPDGRQHLKKEIILPEKYRSAILYVHTPSRNVFNVNILGFTGK